MSLPTKFIAKRVVLFLLQAFIAITVNFFIPRLMPGNVFDVMAEELGRISPEVVETWKANLGLDKDVFTQYVLYLKGLLRGDLGPSMLYYPTPVLEIIYKRLVWTIGLLSVATIIAWVLGNLLGAMVGIRGNTKLNLGLVACSMCLDQIPYFILGIILVFTFSYTIHIFPSSGGYSMFAVEGFNLSFISDVIWHATLPALSIIIESVGGWVISMRSMIVSILGSDYLAFAEAKGLRKNRILMRYAFRNAMLPQVTGLGMRLGFIVSGAMILETIFAYPGIGTTFIDAMRSRDYNLMQGIFLFITLSVLAANLLIDIIYPLIDPRIRATR